MRPQIEKPENQNRTLESTGLAKASKTYGLTGACPGLAHQVAACWVVRHFWKQTNPFLHSQPGWLVGYLDPLLILSQLHSSSASPHLCNYASKYIFMLTQYWPPSPSFVHLITILRCIYSRYVPPGPSSNRPCCSGGLIYWYLDT